jgi:hypothetical protein
MEIFMADQQAQETESTFNPTHEKIAQRAREIFEQSGQIPGRDLENWLAAETELRGAAQSVVQARLSPKSTAKAAPRQSAFRNAA